MLPLISPPPIPELSEDEFYELGKVCRLHQAVCWLRRVSRAFWK